MPLDLNTALNSYGFVGQLAAGIPDLRAILDRAIREEWVPEQFTRTLMDSAWWKTNAESVRQLTRLQATDPATYEQNLRNAENKLQMMAGQMGRTIDQPRAMALHVLLGNFDDEQIKQHISMTSKMTATPDGNLMGDSAQVGNYLREVATNYGMAFTERNVRDAVWRIQSGMDTIDGWEALARQRAKAQFPHLAQQIDAGMTVRDVADPYIATYAQTLEIPETGVRLNDPKVMQALNQRNPDGSSSTKPMWQFQRELKDDPRWDKTNNAKQEAFGMLSRIGKDFGFQS